MISEDERKWLDAWEEDLARFDLATSKKIAYDKGTLDTICSLYKKGIITLETASKEAGISEEEFESKLAEIAV